MEKSGSVASVEMVEGKSKVNGWMWPPLVAGAAVLALLAARRLADRPLPKLGDVVADGLATPWSRRLGVPQERIRPALQGRDSELRDRIGELAGNVTCTFRQEADAGRRHLIAVVLVCDYRNGESTEVTMRIPWRGLPADIRNELLQARTGETVRTWTVG
ncbi:MULTISPECIES: hypothetical protein [Streptomyces]|uniref:Uncharacterized protein n=2 Tax=Streptomyces TaxID=1883 RepID=A0ABV2USZ0_9ACTN|nr:hypothetical protein [Streptomyces indiaensis]MCF1648489.1 hypothetical protein [Streptomyces indiaensis]